MKSDGILLPPPCTVKILGLSSKPHPLHPLINGSYILDLLQSNRILLNPWFMWDRVIGWVSSCVPWSQLGDKLEKDSDLGTYMISMICSGFWKRGCFLVLQTQIPLSPYPILFILVILGFPAGTSCKELTCQCRRHKGYEFDLWVRKIPWRRKDTLLQNSRLKYIYIYSWFTLLY